MRTREWIVTALLASALAYGHGASAAVYDITYTGTVGSDAGINQLDQFGGGDLSGDAFVANYVFDTSKGEMNTSSGVSLQGGSYFGVSDPVVSASLTINGFTLQFSPTGIYDADSIGSSYRGTLISDDDDFLFSNALNNITPPASLTQPDDIAGNGPGAYQQFEGDEETAFSLQDKSIEVSDVPVSAAPEPSTWALMIAGVTATGGTLRFRRRHSALAQA